MPRRADRRRIYAKRYKTDLCRTFQESGFCPYGANCLFAHGAEEMRSQELNVNEGLTVDVISRISRQKIREAHHLNSTPDKTPTRPAPAHRTVSSDQLPSAATSSRANTDAERDSDSQSSLRHASSWPTTTTTVSGDFMRRDSAADVASRARTALRLLWKSTSRHLASTEVPSIAGARGPRRDPYVSVNV